MRGSPLSGLKRTPGEGRPQAATGGGPRRAQEAPGGPRRPQEAPGSPRRPQESPNLDEKGSLEAFLARGGSQERAKEPIKDSQGSLLGSFSP